MVSFASTLDESAAHADLILPASTFLEIVGRRLRGGHRVTPGYRCANRSSSRCTTPVIPAMCCCSWPAALGGPVAAGAALARLTKRWWITASGARRWIAARLAENGVWSEMVYFNAQPGSPAWAQVVGRDRLNAPRTGASTSSPASSWPALASPRIRPAPAVPAPFRAPG